MPVAPTISNAMRYWCRPACWWCGGREEKPSWLSDLGGTQRTTFEVFLKRLCCHWSNGAYLSILLFLFQFSFFLWSALGLFLLFPFAFVFTSLVTHVCFSLIKSECSSQLRQTGLTFSALGPFGPRPSFPGTPGTCRSHQFSGSPWGVKIRWKPASPRWLRHSPLKSCYSSPKNSSQETWRYEIRGRIQAHGVMNNGAVTIDPCIANDRRATNGSPVFRAFCVALPDYLKCSHQ